MGVKIDSKIERLEHLEFILSETDKGYKQSELVEMTGVSKATISRDISELSTRSNLIEEDGRFRIDRSTYLHTIKLSMHELSALHLASRLFARVMKFPFPYAAAALRKLAEAQGKASMAHAEQMLKTAQDIEGFASPIDYSGYREIIEQIDIAMGKQCSFRMVYFSVDKNEEKEYTLYPITLEPHHEGRAVHLFAWKLNGKEEAFRTFKTERILKIDLLPPDPEIAKRIPFQMQRDRLRQAWSIWTSDDPPVPVKLHFSAKVAPRVRETHWHPSMILENQPDGSLIFSAKIAEPREMYPWIRGWGPEVQVIEPESLRQQHIKDCILMAQMYKDEK